MEEVELEAVLIIIPVLVEECNTNLFQQEETHLAQEVDESVASEKNLALGTMDSAD